MPWNGLGFADIAPRMTPLDANRRAQLEEEREKLRKEEELWRQFQKEQQAQWQKEAQAARKLKKEERARLAAEREVLQQLEAAERAQRDQEEVEKRRQEQKRQQERRQVEHPTQYPFPSETTSRDFRMSLRKKTSLDRQKRFPGLQNAALSPHEKPKRSLSAKGVPRTHPLFGTSVLATRPSTTGILVLSILRCSHSLDRLIWRQATAHGKSETSPH